MSNRLFQGIIHQMKDTVDRVIGVIDDKGNVISCSELTKIGDVFEGCNLQNANLKECFVKEGYTFKPFGTDVYKRQVVLVDDQVALLILVIGEGNPVAGADTGAGLIVAGGKDAVGVGGALRQADGVGPIVGFVGNPLAAQIVAGTIVAGDDPLGLVEFPPFLGPVEGHLFTVFGAVSYTHLDVYKRQVLYWYR